MAAAHPFLDALARPSPAPGAGAAAAKAGAMGAALVEMACGKGEAGSRRSRILQQAREHRAELVALAARDEEGMVAYLCDRSEATARVILEVPIAIGRAAAAVEQLAKEALLAGNPKAVEDVRGGLRLATVAREIADDLVRVNSALPELA